MADNTTERPTIQDSDLHDDTVIYRACKPRVRVVEINAFEEIGTILNFRASGMRVAREIIRRQHGENITISGTDADLAEALWPSLPDVTRLTKLVRAKRCLFEDQNNSNFRYVWKVPRQVEQKEDGSYCGLPSKYRPGDYWAVSDELQARSNQKGREFLAMTPYKSRQMEREILSEILAERGCAKIFRLRKRKEKKEEKEKPAKPCSCECASCAKCLAGGMNAARIERLRKSPNEDFNARIEALVEYGYQGLCEVGEINADFRFKAKHVLHEVEMMITRAHEMIVRNNKAGLKLVEGQLK